MTIRKFILATACALMAFLALPTAASAAPAPVTPAQCAAAGETYFLFQYNDSATVGVDQGCADQNDITSAEVPGLIATELHVSCSDLFIGGVGQKSTLGTTASGAPRMTTGWTIIKSKKTCGPGTTVIIPSGGALGLAGVTGIVVALGAVGIGVAKLRRRDTESAVVAA